MINLLKFKETTEDKKETGQEAYTRYMMNVAPLLEKVGGRLLWMGSVKQIFIGTDTDNWDRVLLVEYPRKGLWTLAFQSSSTQGEAQAKTAQDVINVFIPTTPNPTSGFFIMVPRTEVIELEMSVDDGLKMIISAGMVVPEWNPEWAPELDENQAKALGKHSN